MENLIQKNPQPYTYKAEPYEFPLWMRICNKLGPVRIFYIITAVCSIVTILIYIGVGATAVHYIAKYWK